MKDKKYTQLQRIKTIETVVGQMWEIIKKQGEEIKNLKDE